MRRILRRREVVRQYSYRLRVGFPSSLGIKSFYWKDVVSSNIPNIDESIYVKELWIGDVSDITHQTQRRTMIMVLHIDSYDAAEFVATGRDIDSGAQIILSALLADDWKLEL